MPIYEYKCPEGHVFELFHGISEAPPEVCPVCGKGPVTRVLHPVAVHFKGSGFYSTDYGRGSRKPAATEGGDSSGGEKPAADKTEKKPAADAGSGSTS